MTEQEYLNKLADTLNKRFDKEEINNLCFKLGIEADNLAGQTRETKARELLKHLHRHQKIPDLIETGREIRTDIEWPVAPWLKAGLIDTARHMARISAHAEAVQTWQRILKLDPHDPQAPQEIRHLLEKIEQANRLKKFSRQLLMRRSDIAPVYLQAAARLKRMEKEGISEESEVILDIVEDFLASNTTGEQFIKFWLQSLDAPAPASALNYQALAGRLQRGEIVVFLGSDVSTLFTQNLTASAKLVPQLAEYADYPDFQGSFPEICEYLHINNQFGRGALYHKLQELVGLDATIPLYPLLASVPTPILVISSLYDNLLEKNFEQQGKKFVLISHSIKEIGSLFIKYSDKPEIERCSAEQLSGANFMKNGYSLIYKIRGCFRLNAPPDLNRKDSMVLSEQDYFTFIKYTDELIPKYVVQQLSGRGFWLLGHYSKSWEDRLIALAVLRKRDHEEQALTVHQDADLFANAYWEYSRVKNYPVGLQEFVKKLQVFLA
ncbi:MAG: hypothetical protein GY862_03330 [Gammaproteobacteria bacterium]|nr:hypothetical protein [Gammaproteobacteria bacterium]